MYTYIDAIADTVNRINCEEGKGQNPKVTIVTITYNLIKAGRKEFFKKCINSIYSQTYNNIEHVIIDGASNDGTLELIREYAQKSVVYSEPDKGIYDAFNKGILKANGDYIIFLNSDDFFHSNSGIEKSVQHLCASGADFSYSGCYYVDERNIPVMGFEPVMGGFIFRMPFSHQTMLCKKQCLIDAGLFSLDYKISADYDLVMKVILNGASCVRVPNNFVSFRLGGVSDDLGEQSLEDCIDLIYSHFKDCIGEDKKIADTMNNKFVVPKKCYEEAFKRIDESIASECRNLIENHAYNFGNYYVFTKYPALIPLMRSIKILYLPLFKYYIYEDNISVKFLDKWEVITIENNNRKMEIKLNLFNIKIPLFAYRNTAFEKALYLLGIPIFKTYIKFL